ncbi:hypothetical protein D9615_010231 [Tricholomella constricta]|uniref:Uncharacterized protein n=1 Tax=Tricholomella constricta TaxID=117010 RepID=A0A8H5GR98_9AGAR|nr:hypothetical protein D9615_010231 [Tricholomella constricta]
MRSPPTLRDEFHDMSSLSSRLVPALVLGALRALKHIKSTQEPAANSSNATQDSGLPDGSILSSLSMIKASRKMSINAGVAAETKGNAVPG